MSEHFCEGGTAALAQTILWRIRHMHRLNWLSVGLIIALIIGIVLRVFRFHTVPPGLFRDEAFNGMDALETLRGQIRLFYPANNGREPLFIWLVALSIRLLGVSPLAVRFPSLVAGVLTLFTTYGMTRELFGRRIAVFATAVLSVMVWHIHFSRLGFRAILLPLLASISIWFILRSLRTGREWLLVPGGIFAGMLLYTYLSARMVFLPAALFVTYIWHRRRFLAQPTLKQWLLFGIPALSVMAPFLWYAGKHWDEVFLRVQQMDSVFNASAPLRMLSENFLRVLGMFFIRGDFLSRHNVPFRPVFDPGLGLMFCLGVWISLRRFRRDEATAFLVIWTFSFLLPTVLTEECPHFIRAIGILPTIAIFPAIGLDWVWEKCASRQVVHYARGVTLLVFVIALGSTVRDYFIRYPSMPETCYHFECEGVELASDVNTFLEKGWRKGMWVVPDRPARTDRQVYVQFQLWKDVINAHFLIPDSPGFNVPGASEVTSLPPRPDVPMVYYGWYNQYYPDFWVSDLHAWMPPHSLVQVYEGPWAITAQDPSPHPAYLKFVATPMSLPQTTLADLANGISLVDACVVQEKERILLRLIWHNKQAVTTDYTIFVHYERGGQIIAQADGVPAAGYYPTTKWRPGDFFYDERSLAVTEILPQDQIWVGMYNFQTGDRLPVLASASSVRDDRIAVCIKPCQEKP